MLTVAGCTRKLEVGVHEGIIPILSYYQQYRLSDPWGGLGRSHLQNLLCKNQEESALQNLPFSLDLSALPKPAITRERKHFSKIHESDCKPSTCLACSCLNWREEVSAALCSAVNRMNERQNDYRNLRAEG